MTANQGMKLLLQMADDLGDLTITRDSIVCVVAQAGSATPLVAADRIQVLMKREFGPPLHTLVVPGVLHFMEIEALEVFAGLPSSLGEKLQKV
jgi:diphthine synthase